MNLLLDTHVLLWVAHAPEKLGPKAYDAIRNPEATVYVSAATAWELAIKASLGKLEMPSDFSSLLAAYRFTPLDIRSEHALAVQALPHHHRDPFDRLLISQAIREQLMLVTTDSVFAAYNVRTLLATT